MSSVHRDRDQSPSDWVVILDPEPSSVGAARRGLRERLSGMCTPDQLAVAELLASELVTNVVCHANSPCQLHLNLPVDGTLRVEVSDDASERPTVLAPAPTDPHGRGLQLVEALSSRWGVADGERAGKIVWFELHT